MSGAEGPATRRFARLVASPKVRRLSPARLGIAALVSAGLLVLLVLLFSNGLESARAWLHRQPQYRVPFRAIRLDPPPPPWLRGGAPVFLDRIREAASRDSDSFSVLELSPRELKRIFGLDCWVEKVVRVEVSYPNQVEVRLAYRTPVAVPRFSPSLGFLLDRQGSILPAKDVDQEVLEPLIPIDGLDPPVDPHAGEVWKTGDAARGQLHEDGRAVKAAILADFLRAARHDATHSTGTPQILCIFAMKEEEFFVKCGEDIWVHWNHAPGDEEPGHATAKTKWSLLGEWFQKHEARALPRGHFLDFSKNEIVERVGRNDRADRS